MSLIELAQVLRSAIKEHRNAEAMTLVSSSPDLLHLMTPFGTWLHVAASFGNSEFASYLIESGFPINAIGGTFKGNPINEAASHGQLDVVKLLLKHGAYLDTSEPERNPLFGAIYVGSLDIARTLVAAGIDHTVSYTGPSMQNMTAYKFAVERGQAAIADYLLQL